MGFIWSFRKHWFWIKKTYFISKSYYWSSSASNELEKNEKLISKGATVNVNELLHNVIMELTIKNLKILKEKN